MSDVVPFRRAQDVPAGASDAEVRRLLIETVATLRETVTALLRVCEAAGVEDAGNEEDDGA